MTAVWDPPELAWRATEHGWWVATLSDERLHELRERRLRLQRLLGDYERKHTERRGWTKDEWAVGDIGEFAFHDWLNYQGVSHRWYEADDEQLDNPDFEIEGTTVGVKAWRVKTTFQPGYDVAYSAKSVARKTEQHQFFVAYEPPGTALLLGALTRVEFLTAARFATAGSRQPNGGTLPNDNFLLSEARLNRPLHWLSDYLGRGTP